MMLSPRREEIKMGSRIQVAAIWAILTTTGGAQDVLGTDAPAKTDSDRVIAIDVLLEPGPVMVAKAEAANAKLRTNYPEGYRLGREQVAHISLVHRYVHEKDLP